MKKGFTLVELLVVVAILGVLAAVGIVSFGGFLGSAKENAVKTNHSDMLKFVQVQITKCNIDLNDYVSFKKQSGTEEVIHKCIDLSASQWATALKNHFQGSGYKNPYDSNEYAAYIDNAFPTKIGRTNIGYSGSEILIKTKWGNEESNTLNSKVDFEY